MIKILSGTGLKNSFSAANLNKKVGSVNFRSGKNGDIKPGVYQGSGLRGVLTKIGSGKSRGLLEKELIQDGVAGSNENMKKRKAIIELAFGDNNAERIKRNLRSTMQLDESALEQGRHRANVSVLGKISDVLKGTSGSIIAKSGATIGANPATGFALGGKTTTGFAQANNEDKSADNSRTKGPLGGQKPIGF